MWGQLLAALFQLLVLIVKNWLEKDAEKKKTQQEAIDKISQGIKDQDPSAITAGFDLINRKH